MGIRTNSGIYGTVGNIVTYQWKGKDVVRRLPGAVRQSRATKASAKDFGKIKKVSRFLRQNLSTVLPTYKSMPVMFAMDTAVRRWFNEFYWNPEQAEMDQAFFSKLELKPGETPFVKDILGVEPVITWSENKVELQFPAITKNNVRKISTNVTAISFCVKISGALLPESGEISDLRGTSHSIDKLVDVNGIEQFSIVIDNFKNKLEGIFVAYLSLRFQILHQWSDNENNKPVVVIGSWFNGIKPEVKAKNEEDANEN